MSQNLGSRGSQGRNFLDITQGRVDLPNGPCLEKKFNFDGSAYGRLRAAVTVKASCFHAEVRGSNPGGGKDIFSKIFLNLELGLSSIVKQLLSQLTEYKCLHIYRWGLETEVVRQYAGNSLKMVPWKSAGCYSVEGCSAPSTGEIGVCNSVAY